VNAQNLEIVTADVKCYFCGHVSGQVVGYRSQPLSRRRFVARPGGSGGIENGRLRCERCGGPVFIEELPGSEAEMSHRSQPKSTTAA
jgi:hypothetical protein